LASSGVETVSDSVSVEKFAKARGCPLAEEVLLSQVADISLESSLRIASHLLTCDFCAAEAQFLSGHIFPPAPYEQAEMPEHLRELAQALLLRKGFEI
jgi:hypothetical protein